MADAGHPSRSLTLLNSLNTWYVSWPVPPTGFQLQQSTSLGGGATNWVNTATTPIVSGFTQVVPITLGAAQQYFRLIQE